MLGELEIKHHYRQFNRYIEGLVKIKVCGILQLTRINTSKFGENPCTNKVLNGEHFKFSTSIIRTRTTTFSDNHTQGKGSKMTNKLNVNTVIELNTMKINFFYWTVTSTFI